MKFFMKYLICLSVSLFILISFFGCSENNSYLKAEDGTTINILKSKNIAKQNDGYLDTLDAYYDDDYYYYFYELGLIQDVPLEETNSYIHYKGGNATYKFINTKSTSTSIQNCSQKSATKSVYWENSQELSVGINFGKKDVWNVAVAAKFDFIQGSSTLNTWSETFTKCEEFSQSSQQEITLVFDNSCATGYYRYILTGTIKVFATIVKDRKTSKLFATTYSTVLSYGYTLDYDSQSSVFDNYKTTHLEFDLSKIQNLPTPSQKIEKKVNNNYILPLTIFNDYIRTEERKIHNKGFELTDEIQLNQSIAQLKNKGFTKLNFSIKYNLKEQDNCKIYVSLVSAEYENKPIHYEIIEHGGSNLLTSYKEYNIDIKINIANYKSNIFYFKCKAEDALFKDFWVGTIFVTVIAE